jgi:site-specific recombinase XerD
MSVFLRNGKWVVDYWPQGRRGPRKRKTLPTTITTEQEALAIERSIRAAVKEEPLDIPNRSTVNDLFPRYLDWYKDHRKPSTYRDVKGIYDTHFSQYLGSYIASEINHHHFDLYKSLRKTDRKRNLKTRKLKVSNRTINKEVDYFKGFLRWCHKRVRGFPRISLDIEKLPYERPIPTVLTFDEAMKLIMAADSIYRVLFLVLFNLGLRLAPARTMKWQDIDLPNRAFKFIRKGGKPKLLPLSDWLVEELTELKKTATCEWVFPSPRTWLKDQPITDIRRALNRAAKKAGITKKVNAHLLRHSLATHLMGQNINLRTIQEMLGHADISTTEWYTHVQTANIREALSQAGLNIKPPSGVYATRSADKGRKGKRLRKDKRHQAAAGSSGR